MSEQSLKASVKHSSIIVNHPARMVQKGERIKEHETQDEAQQALKEKHSVKENHNGDGAEHVTTVKKEPVMINGQMKTPTKQRATESKFIISCLV